MLNKVMLIGNLGRDPEMRYTQNGKAVATFSMAVTGGAKDTTEWVQITAWEKTAELCAEYLAKGRRVYVEGRLHTETWEKDGEKKYRTGVVASQVVFLDRAPQPVGAFDPDEDELPFD